ncbi:hypothetical protein E0H70_00255 [Rhizobium leguminosarum bv. viciae]|nr:hypothetical protein E0H70_00255 [Rhizobium leguminosarum bv. viciae]
MKRFSQAKRAAVLPGIAQTKDRSNSRKSVKRFSQAKREAVLPGIAQTKDWSGSALPSKAEPQKKRREGWASSRRSNMLN